MSDRTIISVANQLYTERYQDAEVLLLCGSVVRGEHTETSDLDLVVLYSGIPNAYRASYYYQGWPVEAFHHDMQTLHYFFEQVDRPTGIPVLMQMVAEGIEIPKQCAVSDQAKTLARKYLAMGPPVWDQLELEKSRYLLSDLVEDLRGTTNEVERQAIVMRLYEPFVHHVFRSRNVWAAKGKWIPRRLSDVAPGYAEELFNHINTAVRGEGIDQLIELVENELAKDGGYLFEGYTLQAPSNWRLTDQDEK